MDLQERMGVYREMSRAGYILFPLRNATKVPLHKGWQTTKYTATDISDAIKAGHNVGVRILPGQLVVDIDPRNGGMDSAWLLETFCHIPEGPVVVSGRGDGGHHVYLQYDREAYPHLRRKLPDLPGIDFMSSGLVVAPGSIHMVSRKPYVLEGSFKDVPEAPVEILDLYKASAPKLATSRSGRVPPEALAYLLSTLDVYDYGAGHHDEWFDLMCACHDATAGAGIEEFLEWCAGDPTYADDASQASTRYRWTSLTDKDMRKTYLTLFRAVINAGHRDVLVAVEKQFGFDEQPDDAAHDFDGVPVGEEYE